MIHDDKGNGSDRSRFCSYYLQLPMFFYYYKVVSMLAVSDVQHSTVAGAAGWLQSRSPGRG
jgi:hypothetical protein